MSNIKSEIFTELDKLYISKNPFVRNLFCGRIRTALSFAQIKDDSILLDIGCGSGHLLNSIRKINNRCECWGTDVVESEIIAVNCKFKVADARNLPFEDKTFHVVFTLDILEHVKDDVEAAIKEIHRVLMPNGVAILSGPTESRFYRLCRSILFLTSKKNAKLEEQMVRREIDYHFHTIYELEQKFIKHGFKLVGQKSLPRVPSLFRVSRFQK